MSGEGLTIDCDVHCPAPSLESLFPYLSEHWPEYLGWSEFDMPPGIEGTYPSWSRMVGGAATLDDIRSGPLGVASHAIVNCFYGLESLTHPYLAPELAAAVNRHLRDEWLAREERLLGSIVVTPDFPDAAVAEIERAGADARFAQVLVPARSREPYGRQRYWPVWEEVVRCGLVLGITFGGRTSSAPTPVNWPGSYYESYVGSTLAFQSHVSSLVFGGVFDRWPQLRVVILESGWTWAPAFMWRMDAEWRQFQREVPWLQSAPSSYVRRHFRFATQPADTPSSGDELRALLDQFGSDEVPADELLLYSSDFPHVYSRGIDELLAVFDDEQAKRIMGENARHLYALED